MDKEKVLKAMIEAGYFEEMSKEIIKSYDKKDISIQEALNEWVNNKTIKHIEVEGVTIEYIMEKDECDIFCALTTMDVFIKKPSLATKFKETTIFHFGE